MDSSRVNAPGASTRWKPVRPEHDDGVVGVGAGLEDVEDDSDAVVVKVEVAR